jgi:hypothetical protein
MEDLNDKHKLKGLVVEESLHSRFKSVASTNGIKLKDATEQAVTAWVESKSELKQVSQA